MPLRQSGGGGRGAKAVAQLPDITRTKPGDIFILTDDDGSYSRGDLVHVGTEPVAAVVGSIVKAAVVDADFRTSGNPSSQILNYVGAVTARPPGTPATAYTKLVLGFNCPIKILKLVQMLQPESVLKFVHSDGNVYQGAFSPDGFRW